MPYKWQPHELGEVAVTPQRRELQLTQESQKKQKQWSFHQSELQLLDGHQLVLRIIFFASPSSLSETYSCVYLSGAAVALPHGKLAQRNSVDALQLA